MDPKSQNPFPVAPFDAHLYEAHNAHPEIVANPSKAKQPGWSAGYPQRYVFGNPKVGSGIYIAHAIRMMPDGKTPMYDQFLHLERSGGVFLPFDKEGKVGLLPVPRPTTRDSDGWNKAFDKGTFDYSLLGRFSMEVPRGMGKRGETGSQAASREASEEMQGIVTHEYDGGMMVDNTTFSPHMTQLTFGKVDLSRAPLPQDKFEVGLGKVKYYTLGEIDELEQKGDVYDCFTLSAIHRFERAIKNGRIKLQ